MFLTVFFHLAFSGSDGIWHAPMSHLSDGEYRKGAHCLGFCFGIQFHRELCWEVPEFW